MNTACACCIAAVLRASTLAGPEICHCSLMLQYTMCRGTTDDTGCRLRRLVLGRAHPIPAPFRSKALSGPGSTAVHDGLDAAMYLRRVRNPHYK